MAASARITEKPVTDPTAEHEHLTPDEQQDILQDEGALLRGLLAAAEDLKTNTTRVEIARPGIGVVMAFHVRAISEEEIDTCREEATPYDTRGRISLPAGPTRQAEFRSRVIVTATLADDAKKVWGNRALKKQLDLLQDWEVVDRVLKSAEKDKVFDLINRMSGYGDEESLVNTAKNS